jgi:UDP-N-acetylglucosamine 4,6-dehydratase/5-epimerase
MKYLIFGGTGSLGQKIAGKLYGTDCKIYIFSRDEYKQYQMKKIYPKCHFILGDIRDYDTFGNIPKNIQRVFNCAALKHVDIGEKNVDEYVKTNYFGVKNIIKYVDNNSDLYVHFSTDKAVKPINAYGMSKALAEKYLETKENNKYDIQVYRWGNILGSRGSVLDIFKTKILNNESIPLTHPDMTRYWLTLDYAVDFVLKNIESKYPSQLIIPPNLKSAYVKDIASALGQILEKEVKFEFVGMRPGEKIHEELVINPSGIASNSNLDSHYTRQELIEIIEGLI